MSGSLRTANVSSAVVDWPDPDYIPNNWLEAKVSDEFWSPRTAIWFDRRSLVRDIDLWELAFSLLLTIRHKRNGDVKPNGPFRKRDIDACTWHLLGFHCTRSLISIMLWSGDVDAKVANSNTYQRWYLLGDFWGVFHSRSLLPVRSLDIWMYPRHSVTTMTKLTFDSEWIYISSSALATPSHHLVYFYFCFRVTHVWQGHIIVYSGDSIRIRCLYQLYLLLTPMAYTNLTPNLGRSFLPGIRIRSRIYTRSSGEYFTRIGISIQPALLTNFFCRCMISITMIS